jgi:hypothetical protein
LFGASKKPSLRRRVRKSTLAAFEISFGLPQSFREKSRQFVGSFSTKKERPKAPFSKCFRQLPAKQLAL